MLTHGNLASQVDNFPFFLEVTPGDTALSLLPPWHIYQRTTALYLASRAAKEVRRRRPGRAPSSRARPRSRGVRAG
jgi:long-subunit acyl-CoA synthetase (AMP-forming)